MVDERGHAIAVEIGETGDAGPIQPHPGIVEDHRAHTLREHVDVGLTKEGSVGEAAIVQLGVADQLAQVVEIADCVFSGDVCEQ